MEHNEYALHELNLRFNRSARIEDREENFLRFDHKVVEEVRRYVAPGNEFGARLLKLYLDEDFRFSEPLESGARYEIIGQFEHKLDAIIRYSAQYRDRI